jgi:hypothetical protein
MEYGTIMPEIVRTRLRLDCRDIGDKPTHLVPSRTQSTLGELDCACETSRTVMF